MSPKIREALTPSTNTKDGERSNEGGQLMVMIIGYVLLSLLLATVVMAISNVYIEHKKLLSVADSAAVAAADSYSLGQNQGGSSPVAELNSQRVYNSAQDFLVKDNATVRFNALALDPRTGSTDGRTANVVLTAVVHPPVVNFLIPDGIRIEASSTARSRLVR
ncbi:pilus assembly protein TadG-related protein [Pseudarthrobacter sp. J1738]|uniref:pilus assembly protein TadG-related protein n=1 Tax=unclassified Pseudarthrobacter TaxID=2647000 RepID=UPI003D2C1C7E